MRPYGTGRAHRPKSRPSSSRTEGSSAFPAIGRRPPEVESGGEVDLTGSYVTPGFINSHGHVNGLWADESVSDAVERVEVALGLFARYGVTTVNSLGDDDAALVARERPEVPGRPRLRVSGPVVTDTAPETAAQSAGANADAGADWLKLRVDDNLRSSQKMPWEAVEAVLEVGRARGLPVATHLFYLDDAKRLLALGSGMVAHSVRDTAVDEAFLDALRASQVCYVPTLTREVSTFVYATRPDFFDDPFFGVYAEHPMTEQASNPDFMARLAASPTAEGYRVALQQALTNVKSVADAGLPVAMGTDSGPANRFPGYFEHLELWMMVDAGLTAEQALSSATRVAAACLEMPDVGTLVAGNRADFIVFGEDPLQDIRATRSLQTVFIGGERVR